MPTTQEEINIIVDELKWGHPETRKKAAIKLGRIRDIDVIPHLIKTMKNDEYIFARISAIQSLLWIADKSILTPIMEVAIDDDDVLVRRTAIEALGSLKNKDALDILQVIVTTETNEELNLAASNAIQIILGNLVSWDNDALKT